MPAGKIDSVLQHIRKLVAAENAGQLSDRQLLEQFVADRDEAAFAALVQRHGAMVLNVCRRVLHSASDAEDACQVAFLVLARKAGSIRRQDSVGSWLHGVAYRAATNLRRHITRRRACEQQGPARTMAPTTADVSWREVQTILDEEIQRLPENFRAPILLCYLEGKTHNEGAAELGWNLTTFRGRLERGRELLRKRLTRRGVTLSAALLATLLVEQTASAELTATLVVTTVKAALAGQGMGHRVLSTQALTLAQGVMQAMFWNKRKFAAVALLLAIVTGGVGAWMLGARASANAAHWPGSQRGAPGKTAKEERHTQADQQPSPKGRTDLERTRRNPGPENRPGQLASGTGQPKQPAPIEVSVKAQLYEVNDDFFKKLAKSKRLSMAELEELERAFLNRPKEKLLVADDDALFKRLDKQKLILAGKEVMVVNGREATLLSWHKTVRCLPGPDQVRKGDKTPQKVQEGIALLGGVQVSADRRYVRCKFMEKSTEIEAIDKVKVGLDDAGKEAVADVPFLKEAAHSQVRDIPDGGSFLLPLQYRPRASRDKDRWLILCITPRIIIAEEEQELRKQQPVAQPGQPVDPETKGLVAPPQ